VKKITLKLFPFLLSFVFLFPILKESLSSFAIILVCINTIIYKISAKDYTFLEPKTILLTIPFWIILLNSFFSSDFQKSAPHIQHALFFLLIPVVFSLIPLEFFNRQRLNLYITVLKNTCLLIGIIYIICFFMDHSIKEFFVVFQHVSSFRNYIYYDFKLFKIHPTYYTTILILCAAHSFLLVLKQKKYGELLYILFFILLTFLLLTRLNILLLVLVLTGMLLFMSDLKKRERLLFFSLIILTISTLAVLTPGIKDRFVELYNSYNKPPVNVSYDSTNIRKAIFDCSVKISKDNLLLGVGFEKLQTKLNECYKSSYDSSFYKSQNYLTHNYYSYILLSSGLLGLFFYILYLINIIGIAFKTRFFLFYIFLFSTLMVCFIEDYLYRHFGVLYFNLLLICFIQYAKTTSQNSKTIPKISKQELNV
jgi:hypothetical protein